MAPPSRVASLSGSTLALYADAARGMRRRQIAWRLRRLVPPVVLAAGATGRSVPAFIPVARGLGIEAASSSGPVAPPHEERIFTAVGRNRCVDSPNYWRERGDGLLFLFHLHGFSALASYASGPRSSAGDAFWANLLGSWLASEGRPRHPSWHPYPTSLRVVAWAAALSSIDDWPSELRNSLVTSLWKQARYLNRTVEHDIGGNHVLKNAKALVVVGASFPSTGLMTRGLRLLEREVQLQFLADGGHEERSTSYHREVVQDLAEIIVLLGRMSDKPPTPWLSHASERAARWQRSMTGPDGCLPLLNDAWEGPRVAVSKQPSIEDLDASGYLALRSGRDQAIFDRGPVSPRHLPPHAHADALSFVLWADGQPLLVDPGSFSYSGSWRNVFRGTAAHNTVQVADTDQCQLWGDFRVAYPPAVRAYPLRTFGDIVVATGSHDGYRRLRTPVEHHRALVWWPEAGVVVIDLLRTGGPQPVRSFLHISPTARCVDTTEVGPFTLAALGYDPSVRRLQGSYAPYLGKRIDAPVIEDRRVVEPEVPFGWSLLRAGRKVVALDSHHLVLRDVDGSERELSLNWS